MSHRSLNLRPFCLAACVIALLTITSHAQVDRRPNAAVGSDPARGVQRASCVLRLDYDPNRGNRTMESQTLNAMLTSTMLVDPAAEKALGLGPGAWPKVAQIELIPAGNSAVKLTVTLTAHPGFTVPPDGAQAFLDELTSRAQAAVDQMAQRQEQAYEERRAALEKLLTAARERLSAIQAQLRDARGTVTTFDGDPEIRMLSRNPATERQAIENTLAGARARLAVYEKEMANGGDGATTRPAGSPWLELIAARERVVEALRAQSGDRTTEVLEAEAELAEARALAAASTASAQPGFDRGDRWRNDLMTLRATVAENEARLALLDQRMGKTPNTSPGPAATTQARVLSPQDIDRLQREEQRARQEVEELTNQLEQLRRERRVGGGAMAPRLLILDGKPRP